MFNAYQLNVRSANCNAGMLSEIGVKDLSERHYGFVLINETLVSFDFLNRLQDHLMDRSLSAGGTFALNEIVDQEFLSELDASERKVVGDCLLVLIEQGRVAIYP